MHHGAAIQRDCSHAGLRISGLLIIAVAMGWMPRFAAAAEPRGTLVWEENFDDQALPEEWRVSRYPDQVEMVPSPDGKAGDWALANSGQRKRFTEIVIPLPSVDFRVEWRSYASPDSAGGSATPNIGIGGETWSAVAQTQAGSFRILDVSDEQTGRVVPDRAWVWTAPPEEAAWHTYAIEKVGRQLYVEMDGQRTPGNVVLPASSLHESMQARFMIPPHAISDNLRVYDLTDIAANVEVGGMRIGYYPSLGKLVHAVYASRADVKEARITITDPSGKTVLEQKVPVHAGTVIAPKVWERTIHSLDLPKLADGQYTVTPALPDAKGKWVDGPAQVFEHKTFPWEGNTLGITDEVLPPFTPIEVDGRDVEVVLRKYTLTELGLIEQVQAKGQDENEDFKPLLASPVVLVANGDVLNGNGRFTATAPNKVTYEGQAEHPAVTAKLSNLIEEDGCMRIELTLAPGTKAQELKSLSLQIPIKDEMAPLWHLGTRNLRGNPAGFTPEGEGVVWDSRQRKVDPLVYGNFQPYYWFGADARGICWFADNDKGWELAVNEEDPALSAPSQEIIRDPRTGVLTLRVNMIQRPITLTDGSEDSPRKIVFGLMATPAKPMPADWRGVGREDGPRIAFTMAAYYGIPAIFCGKYPYKGDFAIMDFIFQSRLGEIDGKQLKSVGTQVVDEWVKRNVSGPESSDELRKVFHSRLKASVQRVGQYYNAPDSMMLSMYFDEMHATSINHDEVSAYYSEWHDGPWLPAAGSYRHDLMFGEPGKDWTFHPDWGWKQGINTSKLTPSYQDFACWYGAEWLKRGFGLYFDNTFPRANFDPLTTDAYLLPNGRMQSSAGIWAHRHYLRRIWTMHQQLRDPRAKQAMMLHMTNTHIAPYMVWGEANLDLEWKMRLQNAFQEKWPPDLLRAEANGRQTGNYPVAMGDTSVSNVPTEWYETNKESYKRARIMGFLVHEIKPGISTAMYPKPVDEFGYGLSDCKVVNYWDENVPLSVSDESCKWLLLERNTSGGGQRMIVLCTWNPEDAQVTLRFTDKAMTEAADAETNESLPVDGGKLTIPMTGYGSRIILCK